MCWFMHRVILLTQFCKLLATAAILSGWGHVPQVPQCHDAFDSGGFGASLGKSFAHTDTSPRIPTWGELIQATRLAKNHGKFWPRGVQRNPGDAKCVTEILRETKIKNLWGKQNSFDVLCLKCSKTHLQVSLITKLSRKWYPRAPLETGRDRKRRWIGCRGGWTLIRTNERTNEEFIAGSKAHKTQHKYST